MKNRAGHYSVSERAVQVDSDRQVFGFRGKIIGLRRSVLLLGTCCFCICASFIFGRVPLTAFAIGQIVRQICHKAQCVVAAPCREYAVTPFGAARAFKRNVLSCILRDSLSGVCRNLRALPGYQAMPEVAGLAAVNGPVFVLHDEDSELKQWQTSSILSETTAPDGDFLSPFFLRCDSS